MIWKFSRFLKSNIGALDCSLQIYCSIPNSEFVAVKSTVRLSDEVNFAESSDIEFIFSKDSLESSREVKELVEPSVIL